VGLGAERRPQKYFRYILSPEIVSGGNDFGYFFVLYNKHKFSPDVLKMPPLEHDAPGMTFKGR